MTWWSNPTESDVTMTMLDDDNVKHCFIVPAGEVVEIPARFDHGVQARVSLGSPMMGLGPMLVRVDEGTVLAAKAESEAKVTPVVAYEPRAYTKRGK